MRTFLLDIIPKLNKFSQKLDDLTVLSDKHWVIIDPENQKKTIFIFRRKNDQLLISNNGKIEKGTWEYLGNNSLLIDRGGESFLFRHGFIDNQVLALKVDGTEEYALLVNEEKFQKNSLSVDLIIDYLNKKYLQQKLDGVLEIPAVSNNPRGAEVNFIKFNWTFKDFRIPQDLRSALSLDTPTLKYSIKEINYYIKYYKSPRYPFFAALEITRRKEKLESTEIENLRKIAQFYYGTEDFDEVFERMKKEDKKSIPR